MDWVRRKLQIFFSDVILNSVVMGLLAVSCLATWSGVSDFTVAKADSHLAGGLSVKGFMAFFVIVLTVAMYVALREFLKPKHWMNWVPALLLYLVLAIWSIGFGFGFWWSLMAGQSATDSSLRRAMSAVERQAISIEADISSISSQMDRAVRLANTKADLEAEQGGTCGVSSPAGAGKFMQARQETAIEIANMSASIKSDWLAPLEEQTSTLSSEFEESYADAQASNNRRRPFQRSYNQLQRIATRISSTARTQGIGYSLELRQIAKRFVNAPVIGQDPYCYDPDLAASLVHVAEQLERSFEVNVPRFEFSDGRDGVARAVEDLWGAIWRLMSSGAYTSKPDGRTIIALLAAIAIDFSIFVFAIFQARRQPLRLRSEIRQPVEVAPPENREEADIIDADPGDAPLSGPALDPAQTRARLTGPIIDVDDPPDEENADFSGSGSEATDQQDFKPGLLGEIKDRIAKYDNACIDLSEAESEDRRNSAQAAIEQRLQELMDRGVLWFGAEGDSVTEEYEIEEEVEAEGDPGDVVEVIQVGFRHRIAGLVRPARVRAVRKPSD